MDYKIWLSSLRWHGWGGEHTGISPSSQNVSSLTLDQLIYYFIWGTIASTKTNKQNRTKKPLGIILKIFLEFVSGKLLDKQWFLTVFSNGGA